MQLFGNKKKKYNLTDETPQNDKTIFFQEKKISTIMVYDLALSFFDSVVFSGGNLRRYLYNEI